MGKKYKDIEIGDVYGRWTVIETFIIKKVSGDNRKFWKCQCSCENKTIKYIIEYALWNNTSTSCGCFRKEYQNSKNNMSNDINNSLGKLYPKSLGLWSDKNNNTPYNYLPQSRHKAWWKCEKDKHNDYLRTIGNSTNSEFRCPECVRERNESFLQEKVRLYLTNCLQYKLNHERNCSIVPLNPKTKCQLPFDNEIIGLKIIIEVHGLQHYDITPYLSLWFHKNMTPEQAFKQRRIYDRYKKYIAWINGYEYLEIPYWTEKDESYKTLIDNKINEILNKKLHKTA